MNKAAPSYHSYLYTFGCHEDEAELCRLELRTMLGVEPRAGYVLADIPIIASRSPFIRVKMTVQYVGEDLSSLQQQLRKIELNGHTFKVSCLVTDEPISYDEQRSLERAAGGAIVGKAQMKEPDRLFGLARVDGQWLFGELELGDSGWLSRSRKPQNYSTALPARAARALVNLALGGTITGKKLMDPCCGMGTVLIEALTMGAEAEGIDRNPLAVRGARVNLAHYGYSTELVKLGDMRLHSGHYDAVIVDLPYNLCSVLSSEEQLELLSSASRYAARAVVVATERIDEALSAAGWFILDQCALRKGSFIRYIYILIRGENT
ncbi:TRM11 family SAM-dependent methyltransferase [Paenibacillus sp. GCM10023252]|uniref:TRM11 family SAM-dependent methyltransferase n=1 Tax=Paenibacillus sp. GCM10023252 TaxID=3252649 RepID=UPI00361C6E72